MVENNDTAFHFFAQDISHIQLPVKFTFPFCYTPHPLCVMAAQEVQAYLAGKQCWHEELEKGKMFGVLIVRNYQNQVGYLAAFSGNLAHSHNHSYFVPAVYDFLKEDSFFPPEEKNISLINADISKMLSDDTYLHDKEMLSRLVEDMNAALHEAKISLKRSKQERDNKRAQHPDEAECVDMIRESQYQKAEYKRLERSYKEKVALCKQRLDEYESKITALKEQRKLRSAALQQKLFEHFIFLNAHARKRGLCDIFEHTSQRIPPAGAGECAAPKLLQYAYAHKMHPIAMAEFWWGDSPKNEIRLHGHYYPSCKGKCEPILNHMLQGLDVEENPLIKSSKPIEKLEILWEDDSLLVVYKPAGVLSVPGKLSADSVYDYMHHLYPDATGPLIVHRLDMDTSGLLLIAKTKEIHKALQAQFKDHSIKKRYIALLDGVLQEDSGIIDLPLCLDPYDRPRQIVNREYGKPAVTRYEVLERTALHTRVALYPFTGRTHQLRVHSAHSEGLNMPIKGDRLYGCPSSRLYLHAESLEFIHPVTGKHISVSKDADF